MREAVLVTGAAKRVGRVIALHLAARGYDIALHCHRSRAEAETTAAEIRALGATCEIFPCDLEDASALPGLIAGVFVAMPHCRHLVNSASIFERAGFLESDAALYARAMALNLTAPVLLTQSFARHISSPLQGEEQGGGSLASAEANRLNPHPGLPPFRGREQATVTNLLDTKITANRHPYFFYLLAKKALADFTRMAASELGPHLRVNAVCPGYVLPPSDGHDLEGYRARLEARLPLKRTATPEEVAAAVHTLIATPALTGQLLFVDGGEGVI